MFIGNAMTNTECYISVDIETTGPTPGKYSMYELGACLVAEPEKFFEAKIIPLSETSFHSETLQHMRVTMDKILERKNTYTPTSAMNNFAEWVATVSRGMHPIFVGNNAPFDWMFIAWYFEEFGVSNPFGHNALDMKAYYMGMTDSTWKNANMSQMAILLHSRETTLPHRAVEDAKIQARIFSQLLTHNRRTS